MKISLFVSMLILALGSSSVAATKKTCYGSTNSSETKGAVMTAEIEKNQVTLKSVKGTNYEGTFPTYNSVVHGRDGKTYLEYEGNSDEYQNIILVDEALLEESTTGLIQIRARGEGFFNFVYVCRDAR
jgi:hypothetical protein